MDLKSLVSNPSVDINAIGHALDGLSPEDRLAAAHSLNRREQRELYSKAAAAAPLTFDDFVPADKGPLVPVHHAGRNTLPMPRFLQLFEKRFCRPETRKDGLYGYNQSPFIGTVGPGFFVAIRTDDNPTWKERGSIVVDYFQVPDGAVASEWPKVIPNSQGLQKFVYDRTRDFMRRVSKHVTIGAAYKVEKPLDHYFILVRQD